MDALLEAVEAGTSAEIVSDPSSISPAPLPSSDTPSLDLTKSHQAEISSSTVPESGISLTEAVETKQEEIALPSALDSTAASQPSEVLVCTVSEQVTVIEAVTEEVKEEVKAGEAFQATETIESKTEPSKKDTPSDDSESDSSDSEDEEAFRQSLLRRGVKEGEAKSNAFDAEDSDDDFDADIQSRVNNMMDAALEEEGPITTGPPKTVNEEEYRDDPSLPATAPESSDLVLAGRISTLLANDILVTSADHTKTWDVDSVLCLRDGSILGRITELIGRVDRPSYRILIETTLPKQKKDSSSQNKKSAAKKHQANKNALPAPPTDIPIDTTTAIESTNPVEPVLPQDDGSNTIVTEKETIEILQTIDGPSEPQIALITEESSSTVLIAEINAPEPIESAESAESMVEEIKSENPSSMDVDVAIAPAADVNAAPVSDDPEIVKKEEGGEESEASKLNAFYARRKALKARLVIGEVVLCVVDWSKEVNSAIARAKGSDASNAWDEEVGDDELDFSDDEEERKHKERLKNERKQARANGLETQMRGRGAKRNTQSVDPTLPPHPKRTKME